MSEFPNTPRKLDLSRDGERSTDYCSRCSNVAWSSVARELAGKRNHPVMEIHESPSQKLGSSRCQVCKLFALIKPSTSGNSQYQLYAVSASWLFMRLKPIQLSNLDLTDTALLFIGLQEHENELKNRRLMGKLLAIEPTAGSSPVLSPCHIKPMPANYGQIRSWIKYCDENHSGDCRLETTTSAQRPTVIECKTGDIIPLPIDGTYAALSYVWGQEEQLPLDGCSRFSRVVEDSIKVAVALECGYLWVDRHCINQDSPSKQEELERMDKIYSEAHVTIINARAKNDHSIGLAGLTTPRHKRKQSRTNGTQLSYLWTPPREKICSTKWAERGWTYQEGFLSRRRVFFTDEQVIFQCNNMTCLESFSIPMKALHTPDRTRARRLPVLIDMEPLDIRREDIGGHLMEYSKRDLSHQSDALKAFLGILSYFKTKNSWHHFLGNPIHAKESHLINAWYHPEPATRRPEFPSWSWTGWKGALKLTSRDNPDYKLQLETKTGKLVSVHEYIELCDKSQTPDMERFVQLTGKMINVQFERIHRTSDTQIARNSSHDGLTLKNGFWAILPFTNDVVSYSFLYRDDEALKEETGFTLPAMVLETGIHSQNHITVVLVLRKKNNDYERVGLLRMGNATKPEAGDKSWISDVETVVYKDASGHWSKHAPICKLERRVWLKAAEEETIRLR